MSAEPRSRLAVLWDESFMWALIAVETFGRLGLDHFIVTADDVRAGALEDADILFVPGGWASDKTVRLGEDGHEAVRSFVSSGGGYMGFCGGAGLALSVKGGLGLVDASRVPTRHRVPSFSGRIRVEPGDSSHPVWRSINKPYEFYAWWPGQFSVKEGSDVRVVARYAGFGRGFMSADLTAEDVAAHGDGWEGWEKKYGINLDPERLIGEPAMLETRYGDGRVFLSYLHLETPGSLKGHAAIANLITYMDGRGHRKNKEHASGRRIYSIGEPAARAVKDMLKSVREFISFGERNFLWAWRNSWVLHWRRGVRGVEYSILHSMVKMLDGQVKSKGVSTDPDFPERANALGPRLESFLEEARELLMKERSALMSSSMSTIRSDDPEVNGLREKLFSGSKRLGGRYKEILDELDALVLSLLRA